MLEFTEQNSGLLIKLHPALEDVNIIVENGLWPYESMSDILLQTLRGDMCLKSTCEEFQFKLAPLETCDNFKDIVDEIIPHKIDSSSIEEVFDYEIEELEIFRKLLGHLLWLAKCLKEYKTARADYYKMKTLHYRAAKYYKKDAKLWLELAIINNQAHPDRDIINEAIKFVPDSENLRIGLAKIDLKNAKIEKVQEMIDRTLISFADDGYEVRPNEWIKAAKKANLSEEIIDAFIISIMGIKGLDENVKSSEIYLNHEKRILFQTLEAFSKNKRLWVRVIFHKKIDFNDLKLLLIIAYEKNPYDVAFGDLTQAKIQWMNEKFAIAQRLFKKLKANTKWRSLIIEEFEQFQSELEMVRARRQIMIKATSYLREILEDYCSKIKFKLQMILKDEWLLGEHDVVEKALMKAIFIEPSNADFWLIKMQIEIKKADFDTAAAPFESASKSVCLKRAFLLIFIANYENERGNLQKARNLLERVISSSPKYLKAWIALIRLEISSNETSKAQTLLAQAFEVFPNSGQVWAEAISMEERSKRGKKAAEALGKCHDNDYETMFVMLETAKLFFSQGQVEKSRKWFNKTVEKYPDFCDAWIYFYKLEKIWGTEKSVRNILMRFIQKKSELNNYFYYGEKWCKFENHIDNWALTSEELFQYIIDKIDVGSI